MTKERRHLNVLARRGISANIVTVAGDVCPCLASRDGSYNAIWHDDHPASANCSGSGVINRVKTTTAIKSNFINNQEELGVYLKSELKIEVGIRNNIDLIMFGAVKTSDYSKFDLTILNKHSDYVVFNSVNYSVKDVIYTTACQIGTLEKIEYVV